MVAALTATDADLKTRPNSNSTYHATASDIFYQGGGMGGVTATGLLTPWNDTSTTQWQGVCVRTTGTTAARDLIEVDISGLILTHVPVASAVAASVGERVFCTTDNIGADLALTATSLAIGVIIRWVSATDCDVRLFTPTEANAMVDS